MNSKITAAFKSVWKSLPPPPPAVEDHCDWEHIPTKTEILHLLQCKVLYPNVDMIVDCLDARPAAWNEYESREEQEAAKDNIRQGVLWQDNQQYQFPLADADTNTNNTTSDDDEKKEDTTSSVSTIRAAYVEYQKSDAAAQRELVAQGVRFWEKLADQLNDEQWEEMWCKLYCDHRYEINWLLYLETLQPTRMVEEPNSASPSPDTTIKPDVVPVETPPVQQTTNSSSWWPW